ncbi:MAG: ABC transporter substrate-binding protein [Janthinobacterium lividum]
MSLKMLLSTALVLSLTAPAWAQNTGAQTGEIRIGVLNDRSGYQTDLAGEGSAVAARLAAEDFGGTVNGRKIVILSADMQNKPDVAASIARQWLDTDGVDVIADNQLSSAALAVQDLARVRGKITINVSSATTDLTGNRCSPTGFKWSYDTYSAATGTGKAVVAQGGRNWFFFTADYTFGKTLQTQTSKVVEAAGGKVLGAALHPIGTSDFSSYILQAISSGAQVIGLANGGTDTIGSIKQGREFGLGSPGKPQFAGLTMFITDVHALGLESAQGLLLTTTFYWDKDEASRTWAKRFFVVTGKMPTMVHAGVYSGVNHYLEAVKTTGSNDGPTVAKAMHAMSVNDATVHDGSIMPNGRVLQDVFLVRVKTPVQSKQPWDYYDVLSTIPGKDAFMAEAESGCKLP